MRFMIRFSDVMKCVEIGGGLIEIFGSSEEFEKELRKEILQLYKVIQEEFDIKFEELVFHYFEKSPATPLRPKSKVALRNFKKWICKNYQFPKR